MELTAGTGQKSIPDNVLVAVGNYRHVATVQSQVRKRIAP